MEYEKLALEVGAVKAGLRPVSPPVLKGDSGIEHRFALLFSSGARMYGFDFYDSVSEIEALGSYAKKFDTHISLNLVCLNGEITDGAQALCAEYDMKILTPKAAETFFALEPVVPRSIFH